jgi:hypothetical protein
MLQNQRNRLTKVREAFLMRFALSVGAGHFGAIGDVPRPVPLNDRCEPIVHTIILSRVELERISS